MLKKLSHRIRRILVRSLTRIADAIEKRSAANEDDDNNRFDACTSTEPPAHWLAKVREGAPHLLDETPFRHDLSPSPGEQNTFKTEVGHHSYRRQPDRREEANGATGRFFTGKQRTGLKQGPKLNGISTSDAPSDASSSSQTSKETSSGIMAADNERRTVRRMEGTVQFFPDEPTLQSDRQDPATQTNASAAREISLQQPSSSRKTTAGDQNRKSPSVWIKPQPISARDNDKPQNNREKELPVHSPGESTEKAIQVPALHLYPRSKFHIETTPAGVSNVQNPLLAETMHAFLPQTAAPDEVKNPALENPSQQKSGEILDQLFETFLPGEAQRKLRSHSAKAETFMSNIAASDYDFASQESIRTTSVPPPIPGYCHWPDLPDQNRTETPQGQWPQLPNDHWSDPGNTDIPSAGFWRLQEQAKRRLMSIEEQRGTLWNG